VIARIHRGDEVLEFEPRRPVPWGLVDLLLLVMAYFLFHILGQVTLREAAGVRVPEEIRDLTAENFVPVQLSSMVATLATLLFGLALLMARAGATRFDLGLSLDRWWYDLRLGLLGFLALAAPVYALQALLVHFFPTQHPLIDLLEAHHDDYTFFVVGLSVSVLAPVSEEFFIRVFLQGWLEKVAATTVPLAFRESASHGAPTDSSNVAADDQPENPYAPSQVPDLAQSREEVDYRAVRAVPIVASALIFALLHVGQGPAPIPLFFLALGLGYLYQRTHRLWPSLVVHFLLNSTSLALLWTQLR